MASSIFSSLLEEALGARCILQEDSHKEALPGLRSELDGLVWSRVSTLTPDWLSIGVCSGVIGVL